MPEPVPSRRSTEREPRTAPPTAAGEGPDENPGEPAGVPLNRAARRAKAAKAQPTHVGPRAEQERKVRGAPARTKRSR